MTSHPVWVRAAFPRSGMCVFWLAAQFGAKLSPARRGGGLVESPAACSLEESSAVTGQDKARTSYYIIFPKKIDCHLAT